MPPKRNASGPAKAGPAKRSKPSASTTARAAPPKSLRWSAVSASRNADASFKDAVQDFDKAYSYLCICQPPFTRDDYDPYDDDDDDDDESGSENEDNDGADKEGKKPKTKCDGGKSCLCNKPASEHPDHEWTLTKAGYLMFMCQCDMSDVRDPDNFDMYTYNGHRAYGCLEIIQNLFLDFDEASTWQEQWSVCEGFVLFLSARGDDFNMIEDGDLARDTAKMIGRLFLAMLSRLEALNLLSDGSPVKNLGLMMTMYIRQASTFREGSLLEDDDEEKLTKPSFKWEPGRFDDYIHAYANKYGIRLYGVDNIDEVTAELKEVSLPATGEHLWDWPAKFEEFKEDGAFPRLVGGRPAVFGGDSLDITSWTSAMRKKYSFGKKDPLGKKELDALKSGMVMSLE